MGWIFELGSNLLLDCNLLGLLYLLFGFLWLTQGHNNATIPAWGAFTLFLMFFS
jgi:hypothetical protein